MTSSDRIALLFISLTAIFVFVISNLYLGGYLHSLETLAKEIKSPPNDIAAYQLSKIAPFNHRLLFPFLVNAISQAGLTSLDKNMSFFWTYYFVSMAFYITAALSFYHLLRVLGFTIRWSLVGSLCLISLPGYFLAFSLPVHTREDMLGYTLLCLGLTAIESRQQTLFMLVAVLGVLTRETLLILPFVYLFFSRDSLMVRLVLSATIILIFVAQYTIIGSGSYDIWHGLHWNLKNYVQVIGFGFLSFHIFWFTFVFSSKSLPSPIKDSVIGRSSNGAVVLIIATTFLFGIFNEIRLISLAFPWILITSLDYFRSRFHEMGLLLSNWLYRIYLIILPILFLFAAIWLSNNWMRFIPVSRYSIPYEIWIYFAMAYSCLVAMFAPCLVKIEKYHVHQ